MTDEPFGRQPKPVYVTITGESEDVTYWQREFVRRAEFKGSQVNLTVGLSTSFLPADKELTFTIYPRAIND